MRVVYVYFASFRVGRIRVSRQGDLSFSYDAAWQATPGAFPLSLSMPLGPAEYLANLITPWLANLLPEGEQLEKLSRSLGRSPTEALGLLTDIGGDTAGALSFAEPNASAAWRHTPLTEYYETEDPAEALEQHFEDVEKRPFLADEGGSARHPAVRCPLHCHPQTREPAPSRQHGE